MLRQLYAKNVITILLLDINNKKVKEIEICVRNNIHFISSAITAVRKVNKGLSKVKVPYSTIIIVNNNYDSRIREITI